MREPTRAFTAIVVDDATRESLGRCQDELRALKSDVRWTSPAGFHVTLQFLGTIDAARRNAYENAMRGALDDMDAFRFRVEGLGCFPDRRKPRVLWAGVTVGAEAITTIHERLDRAFEPLGHEPERRPFHPHVTIGRLRGPRGLPELRERLVRMLGPDPVELSAKAVHLQRSRRTPHGAIYDTLLAIPLQSAVGGRG